VQQNLLAIQVSYIISDMVKVWETIETELEVSIRAFLEADGRSSVGGEQATDASARTRKSPRASRS
jgi:hypothetical protein